MESPTCSTTNNAGRLKLDLSDDVWIELSTLFLGPVDLLSFQCACLNFSKITNPLQNARVNKYWQHWCNRITIDKIAWDKVNALQVGFRNWQMIFVDWVTFLIKHKYLSLVDLKRKPSAVKVTMTEAIATWPNPPNECNSEWKWTRNDLEKNAIMESCKDDNLTVFQLLLISNNHIMKEPKNLDINLNSIRLCNQRDGMSYLHLNWRIFGNMTIATPINFICYYNSVKIATFLLTKDQRCENKQNWNKENRNENISIDRKKNKNNNNNNNNINDSKSHYGIGLKNLFFNELTFGLREFRYRYDSSWNSSLGICCLQNSVDVAKLLFKHPKISNSEYAKELINKKQTGIFNEYSRFRW